MKIENTNSATSTIHDAECMDDDYRVTFDDGIATVREPVGTALIEKYPSIEAVEDESDAADDAPEEPPPDDEADGGAGGGGDGDEPADDNSDTNETEEQ